MPPRYLDTPVTRTTFAIAGNPTDDGASPTPFAMPLTSHPASEDEKAPPALLPMEPGRAREAS
jgi:hypothetical protein